jgi:hypothetical protein
MDTQTQSEHACILHSVANEAAQALVSTAGSGPFDDVNNHSHKYTFQFRDKLCKSDHHVDSFRPCLLILWNKPVVGHLIHNGICTSIRNTVLGKWSEE